jgi:hydrogenase/urease accessory protein HupE
LLKVPFVEEDLSVAEFIALLGLLVVAEELPKLAALE